MTFIEATFVQITLSTSKTSQLLLTWFNETLRVGFLRTPWTNSNFHNDSFTGNICSGNICPYSEYLSYYWRDLNQLWTRTQSILSRRDHSNSERLLNFWKLSLIIYMYVWNENLIYPIIQILITILFNPCDHPYYTYDHPTNSEDNQFDNPEDNLIILTSILTFFANI